MNQLQLALLLWKNIKLLLRQPIRLVLQLLIPLVLFVLLVWVKTEGLLIKHTECHYDAKPLPSAGPLPFLQGLICTAGNSCYMYNQNSEDRDKDSQFNRSAINRVYNDLNTLIQNKSCMASLTSLLTDLATIQQMRKLSAEGNLHCEFSVAGLPINTTEILMIQEEYNFTNVGSFASKLRNTTIKLPEMLQLANLYTSLSSAKTEKQKTKVIRTTICIKQKSLFGTGKEKYFFIIDQHKEFIPLVERICKLDDRQFYKISRILLGDIALLNIREQLNNCTETSLGRSIKTTSASLSSSMDVLNSMQSIQKMFEFMQVSTNDTTGNSTTDSTTKAGNFMSKLFCGRPQLDIMHSLPQMPKTLSGVGEFGDDNNNDASNLNHHDYDNSTTPFCNNLFADIQKTAIGRIIWRQIKPMIRGYVTYTPDTPIVRDIIKQANSTFENLYMFRDVAKSWLKNSVIIMHYLNTDPSAIRFRENLDTIAFLMPNSSSIQSLSSFFTMTPNETKSLNWRDTLLQIDDTMTQVIMYMDCVNFDKFIAYESEEVLVAKSMELYDSNSFWAGLVFDISDPKDNTTLSPVVKYKIRIDTNHVDHTYAFKVKDRLWIPGPRDSIMSDLKYVQYGFIYLQDMIDQALIKLQTGHNVNIGLNVQQFPYPCYIRDDFIPAISGTIPLFMTISWILSISTIVKGVVFEKEQRLKEVMKVMGLTNSNHWLASFITNFAVMFITIVMLVCVLKFGNLLEHTNIVILFIFVTSFGISTISLCFLISVFFDKANIASVCAGIFFFITYLPYAVCLKYEDYLNGMHRTIASLSANVASGFGWTYISKYEQQGTGVQWEQFWLSPMYGDTFSLGHSVLCLLADAIIYLTIAFYVEAVWPGEYGMPLKWYYFVQKSYWMPNSKRNSINEELNNENQMFENYNCESTANITNKLGVKLVKLRKKYRKVVAVESLTLNFYEGQITSFLGHNGAGKTTTMSILTGLFPPTSGTAFVYGNDIRSDINEIRKIMGVCPQYNVLFNMLTVEEHLWFYSKLKGLDNSKVKSEIDKFIKDIGLEDKRSEYAKNLSGGMKRKLSIAMAFIGDSRLVILDEPTAGVDPYSRKSIWDLLLKYKADRTIILTTHHMDEADLLSDRVAILSHGKLCCYGTSLYLKSRYGSGYYLTASRIVPTEGHSYDSGVEGSSTSLKLNTVDGTAELTELIQSYLSKAVLVEDMGSDITYQLTNTQNDITHFSELFSSLDLKINDFGFSSYGISDTTLEEVFLKVIDSNESQKLNRFYNFEGSSNNHRASLRSLKPTLKKQIQEEDDNQKYTNGFTCNNQVNSHSLDNGKDHLNDVDYPETDSNLELKTYSNITTDSPPPQYDNDIIFNNKNQAAKGIRLLWIQFWALTMKRLHHSRRSKKSFISQLLLPIVFVCMAMLFAKMSPSVKHEPPMELHPWYLADIVDNLKMFFSNDKSEAKWTNEMDKLLSKEDYAIGNRCLPTDVYEIEGYKCKKSKSTSSFEGAEPITNKTINCDCSSGFKDCKDLVNEPGMRILPSTDFMYNMTGRNISDWIVKTTTDFRLQRFGGLSYGEENELSKMNTTELAEFFQIIGNLLINSTLGLMNITNSSSPSATTTPLNLDLQEPNEYSTQVLKEQIDNVISRIVTKDNAKIWFNNKGYVSIVAYTNIMNNALLRTNLPPGVDPSHYAIITYNHPMNRTRRQLELHLVESSAVDLLIAISVIIAMSFIPATFILFLTEERATSSKLLQMVSGVRPYVYWAATFTWDMICYLFTAAICILIFYLFQIEAFVSHNNFPCLVLLIILYGYAVTPLMYLASRLFTVPSSSFVTISSINVFIGIISTVSTFIMDIYTSENVVNINNTLKAVFLVFPQYCLGRGLIELTANQIIVDTLASYGETATIDPFQWNQVGRNLVAMAIQCGVLNAVVVALEYNLVPMFFVRWYYARKIQQNYEEDIDVKIERDRINNHHTTNDSITVKNLSKIYYGQNDFAVNNLCFGVKKGECFGLLGVNGAGKTTTFKLLTGDISVTLGNAHLDGHSILTDIVGVHKRLGYCPQFDALSPLLNTTEHLYMYARLHGLYGHHCDMAVKWALERFNLYTYRHHLVSTLSGGNKRKLSTAIALVGNPQVVFLDEPTTGMDPKARRFIWKCISDITQIGRSVVLTSHSMEECQILCNRMAIMVSGRFQCLGSVQHLKNRFGNGYSLTIHLSYDSPENSYSRLASFMTNTFPQSIQCQRHSHTIEYQLGSKDISLATIFRQIEEYKSELHINNYSVCQTTLDQVFVNFANRNVVQHHDNVKSNGSHKIKMKGTSDNVKVDEKIIGQRFTQKCV